MTIHTMTRKRQRRRDSTESSSFEAMELSKPPKGVLELGQHLVRELRFEDGVDTLGRWMAHHLAELLDQAENAKTKVERSKARKQATETILKVWGASDIATGQSIPARAIQRCPGGPRTYCGPTIILFDIVTTYDAEARKEQLAAGLFDGLSRLIIALLLMKLSSDARTGRSRHRRHQVPQQNRTACIELSPTVGQPLHVDGQE